MFPHRPPENKLFTLLLPVILLRAVKKKNNKTKQTNGKQKATARATALSKAAAHPYLRFALSRYNGW